MMLARMPAALVARKIIWDGIVRRDRAMLSITAALEVSLIKLVRLFAQLTDWHHNKPAQTHQTDMRVHQASMIWM